MRVVEARGYVSENFSLNGSAIRIVLELFHFQDLILINKNLFHRLYISLQLSLKKMKSYWKYKKKEHIHRYITIIEIIISIYIYSLYKRITNANIDGRKHVHKFNRTEIAFWNSLVMLDHRYRRNWKLVDGVPLGNVELLLKVEEYNRNEEGNILTGVS